MKGYFILHSDYDKRVNTGVYHKIQGQISAFINSGLECKEITQPTGREGKKKFFFTILHRLPFTNTTPRWEYIEEIADADYIYMRRPPVVTLAMRRVLKQYKRRNPHIKILMEIPSYPYEHEFAGIKNITLLLKDRYNRKRLKGLLDCVTVIGCKNNENTLWGIHKINFLNGIDLRSIPLRQYRKEDNSIHLLCVAFFSPWHGYERIFYGLRNYVKDEGHINITIDMVGEGQELAFYKELVKKLQIEKHVNFHGKMNGDKLRQFYDIADFGVCGLGWYKEGFKVGGDLKSREYLAAGVPMITGIPTDIFQDNEFRYNCEFPNSDEPIDMYEIEKCYKKIYMSGQSPQKVTEEIRSFAERYISFEIVMRDIIKYIKGE